MSSSENILERKEVMRVVKAYDEFQQKVEQANKLRKQAQEIEETMKNGRANLAKLKALIEVDDKEINFVRKEIADAFAAIFPKPVVVEKVKEVVATTTNNGADLP